MALAAETLERCFNAAFGVGRSDSDRNALFIRRLQQTEADLAILGEAYAEPDILREDNERLKTENQIYRDQIEDLGSKPWQQMETEP